MKARERDLQEGAPLERFGNAVMRCEGFTPDCVHHSRCMRGGECFASPGNLVAARLIESLIPSPRPAGLHFAYLQHCAEMLRAGKVML
jgi:hypothetical protein